MGASSPLGKFSEPAAVLVALALIAAWLAAQLGLVAVAGDTTALTAAATLAIGIVLGQRATTNGAAKIAAAAHKRLDAINAPPADDGIATAPSP